MVFDWFRGTVMVMPRGCLFCPPTPYSTSTYLCPGGISAGDEMYFTSDIDNTSASVPIPLALDGAVPFGAEIALFSPVGAFAKGCNPAR
jgi:hypothetical protein